MASAAGGIRPWLTDVEPTEDSGSAIVAAISRYHAWYTSGKKTGIKVVRAAMLADLTNSKYDATRRDMLADRIIQMYEMHASLGKVVPPTGKQDTLDFIQARQMCLEWAVTIAINAHGLAKGYATTGSKAISPGLYRPGMGLYQMDHQHAMLIVDIYWDKSGQPQSFRVAEANYGKGWQNPGGMVPWERTVQNTRVKPPGTDHVVDFEAP
jgi:hypothetical protein